jgi:membrane-associated phospholipid phosphatase
MTLTQFYLFLGGWLIGFILAQLAIRAYYKRQDKKFISEFKKKPW